MSQNRLARGLGVPLLQLFKAIPSPRLYTHYYDRHCVWLDFPRTPTIQWTSLPYLYTRGNDAVIYPCRNNHIASLFEMSLFTCSRMRTLTTISCAQESASHGVLLVIENSEPPQGARVLTDEQSRLTPTDANG